MTLRRLWRDYRPRTLKLTPPAGYTLVLAAAFVAIYVLLIEAVLRVPAVQSRLPAPSVRNQHVDFEIKLQRLREMGSVDCVFLGTSIVDRGLSPADFEQAYQAAAGQPITCFNFGVDGAGEYTGVLLAQYVTRVVQPRLLVFGVSPRLGNDGDGGSLAALPWLKYQQGQFSLHGWLAEHSRLYGYSRPLVNAFFNTLSGDRRAYLDRMILANGFYPTDERITFPIPSGDRGRLERSNYAISEAWLSRLDEMLAFHRPPQTRVVIVEMPVHPVALEGRADRQSDYADSMAAIGARTEAKGVPFFTTNHLEALVADENWADFNHLNATGARVISRWLGERVGEAVEEGAFGALAD